MQSLKVLTSFCAAAVVAHIVFLPVVSLAGQDPEKKAKALTSYTMGVVYDFQGLTQKAISEYEKAAEYEDNYAVHLRLGADYARLGKMSAAETELHNALKYDPANVQARYLLALIYSSQKDYDKASQEYESILKSFSKAEPENIEIYGYLGQLYYSRKDYKRAIEQFETVLSLAPDNTDMMFLLGTLYLETEQRPRAIELFSRCIKQDPENDSCLNSLGYMYAEDGIKLDEAQKLVEQALKVDPSNGAYLDSLGWVYYRKGEYQKSLDTLKQADALLKDPVIYDHMGDVYSKLQQIQDAKKYWSLSLELLPGQESVQKKLKSVE